MNMFYTQQGNKEPEPPFSYMFNFYILQDYYVKWVFILFLILAEEANSTVAPLLYSMWPSLRGAGYQAD